MIQPYWFRNKSSQLIQQSTFANKAAGRSGCVWRVAPHVTVFIVSPPLKIKERFPKVNIGNIALGGDQQRLEMTG